MAILKKTPSPPGKAENVGVYVRGKFLFPDGTTIKVHQLRTMKHKLVLGD